MEFLKDVFEYIMDLFGKLPGWTRSVFGFMQMVEEDFSGFWEIVEKWYEEGKKVIEQMMAEGRPVEEAQAEAREMAVLGITSDASASPKSIPEQAARMGLEAMVYMKKAFTEGGTKYDTEEVMKKAQDILRRGGGHGK